MKALLQIQHQKNIFIHKIIASISVSFKYIFAWNEPFSFILRVFFIIRWNKIKGNLFSQSETVFVLFLSLYKLLFIEYLDDGYFIKQNILFQPFTNDWKDSIKILLT